MQKKKRKASKKPLLTVTVPAYNVAQYLDECLQSLAAITPDKLEVIIVDDGSTDKTAGIAEKFTKEYRNFFLISKENGGHGSTINAGLEAATGKYFRLLDGDDIFVTEALNDLLEYIEQTDTDIILTDYTEFYMNSGVRKPINNYLDMSPDTRYDLDSAQATQLFRKLGPLLSTTTFRTALYKEDPFSIDENSYYVDMEYNFFIYERAKNVAYLPRNIYLYRLDREGQSMQKNSLIKHHRDHTTVSLRLAEELFGAKDISRNKYDYLLNSIVSPMCSRNYVILTQYVKRRSAFMEFDTALKKYPTIYESPLISGKIMRMHRKSRGVTIAADALLHKIGDTLKHLEKK